MKNIPFFIVLINYYLLAAILLDVISREGFLHAFYFLLFSVIVLSVMILVFRAKTKSNTSYWELLKRFAPSVIGSELILLILLRMYIFSRI